MSATATTTTTTKIASTAATVSKVAATETTKITAEPTTKTKISTTVAAAGANLPELMSVEMRASDSSDADAVVDEKRQAAVGPSSTSSSASATTKPAAGKKQRRRKSKAIRGLDELDEQDRASLSSRFKTFRKSFKFLVDLTPKQVDDFMASYVIYNLDWADEPAMVAALGPDYRDKVGECLKAYYGVLNHLCALGDVEKMYIPPLMDRRATVLENQLLYERAVARAIGASPGDRLLDLGCGRGRVAAHMALVTGAQVTGLNIDPSQIESARKFNVTRGLNNEFVVQDFNALPLPFADSSFDGFYQIQALSLCKDLPGLFREIHRVLRPGAKVSLLDWVSFPSYDPNDPEHMEMMSRVKPLIGAVGTPTPELFEQALKDAGFVVTRSENASVGGLQAPLIERVDVYFRAVRQIILALVKVRVLPSHFKTLINRLCLDGEAFVKMDKMRLITTSYWIVAEKPAEKPVAAVEEDKKKNEEVKEEGAADTAAKEDVKGNENGAKEDDIKESEAKEVDVKESEGEANEVVSQEDAKVKEEAKEETKEQQQ